MESIALTDCVDLKVREPLKEVRPYPSPTFTKPVDDTVSAIKDTFDKIPEDLKVTGDEAPGFVRDIGADKFEFNFKKPKSVEIGGCYAIECTAKPRVNVDIFIRLPKYLIHPAGEAKLPTMSDPLRLDQPLDAFGQKLGPPYGLTPNFTR